MKINQYVKTKFMIDWIFKIQQKIIRLHYEIDTHVNQT